MRASKRAGKQRGGSRKVSSAPRRKYVGVKRLRGAADPAVKASLRAYASAMGLDLRDVHARALDGFLAERKARLRQGSSVVYVAERKDADDEWLTVSDELGKAIADAANVDRVSTRALLYSALLLFFESKLRS